jgi:hypothetical protein
MSTVNQRAVRKMAERARKRRSHVSYTLICDRYRTEFNFHPAYDEKQIADKLTAWDKIQRQISEWWL